MKVHHEWLATPCNLEILSSSLLYQTCSLVLAVEPNCENMRGQTIVIQYNKNIRLPKRKIDSSPYNRYYFPTVKITALKV